MSWAFKGFQVQPGVQFSPAPRECESVGIWLRTLGNAAYVGCLPLLSARGPSGLNGEYRGLLGVCVTTGLGFKVRPGQSSSERL